jgi:hypothetical protein
MESLNAAGGFNLQRALRIDPQCDAVDRLAVPKLQADRLPLMRMTGMPCGVKRGKSLVLETRQRGIERSDQAKQQLIAINMPEVC